MSEFLAELSEDLNSIRQQGLYRELRALESPQAPRIRIAGREYLSFSSNDYLGLANHSRLKQTAIDAIEHFGAGAGSSRLVAGTLAPHQDLEQALAQFKGTEAALCFCSGYAAAVGVIGALLGRSDVIVIDKRAHACIIDAARMSGAKLRAFAHNDLDGLEHILQWANGNSVRGSGGRSTRVLVVTESVFSMDGDCGRLAEIVELKNRYGAWLMVDEAHATGLYGEHRRGLAEAYGIGDQIEIQMGTLSKAVGSSGGYIVGARILIEFLVNRARSFIYSTAPPPAAVAAARAGIEIIQSDEGARRCRAVWDRVAELMDGLSRLKRPTNSAASDGSKSAIIPLLIGDEGEAVTIASALRERGVFVPAIRYPTVARGAARLRLSVTADHTSADIQQLLTALAQADEASRQDALPN